MVKKLYSTMDFPLKTRLALFFDNIIHKPIKDSVLGVNDNKTSISQVLFILPEEINYSRVARIFIQSIQNALGPDPEMNISYALSKSSLISYEGLIQNPLILFSTENLNYWELPNNELINECKKLDFHAVIDLNPDFNPFASTLIKYIKANVKIGYYSKYAEKYYNIIIERKETDFLEKGNSYILQLLGLK